MESLSFKRKAAINPSILRVIIFLLCWLLVVVAFESFGLFVMKDLFPDLNQRSPVFFSIARSFETLFTIGLIYIFRRYIDHRPFLSDWLSLKNKELDLPIGFFIGGLLIVLGAFILGWSGVISFFPGNLSVIFFFQYLFMFFIGAILEELVFRGYILDNLLEDMHPILAVIVSSGLFMLLHISNPNLDGLSLVNLFLAGVLMSIPFVYTRNLWLPLGIHWGWNFFQGPIFGYEVSGLATTSLYKQEIKPDEGLWSGGEFGFEGSLLATILMVIASLAIFFYYQKKQKTVEDN